MTRTLTASIKEMGQEMAKIHTGDANYKGFNIIQEGGKWSVKNVMGGRQSVHGSEAEARAEIDKIEKSRSKDCMGTKDCGCGCTHDGAESPTKLTAAQERDLADLEHKAEGDYMTPGDRDRLVRLRKLKKHYGTRDAAPKLPGKHIHIHLHR